MKNSVAGFLAGTAAAFLICFAAGPGVSGEEIPVIVRNPRGTGYSARPVTVGVPFPEGVLWEGEETELIGEDGEPLPLQTSVTSRHEDGSVRWLLADFQADMERGREKTVYSLNYGRSPRRPAVSSGISTERDGNTIIVDTGRARFVVDGKGGALVKEAWVYADTGARKVISRSPGSGPYLVEEERGVFRGALYDDTRVKIEESGPLKTVVRVEGFYLPAEGGGGYLGGQVSRLYFYAGKSYVKISHTWINTAASGEAGYSEIGIEFPVENAERIGYGTPGGVYYEDIGEGYDGYLLQHWHDAFMVKSGGEKKVSGDRAPGWVRVENEEAGAALGVRDFWQNFPKELGFRDGRLVFCVWPRNGIVHTRRELTDSNLYMLDFAHQGSVLDFSVPREYHSFGECDRAYRYVRSSARANAIGLAKTHEFWLYLYIPDEDGPAAGSTEEALLEDACVLPDPGWMASSGAFGRLLPFSPGLFPETEEILSAAFDAEMRLNEFNEDYGMFNWGGGHHGWNFRERAWSLSRAWRNTHHGAPQVPWILYARSGEPKYLRYALRNTARVLDTGYVHYTREEFEGLPYPEGKITGGLNDYKGLVPWHAGSRVMDYNSMTDFMLYYYHMTGNRRGLDVALSWGEAVLRDGGLRRNREGAGTLAALIPLYETTRDERFRRHAEALFVRLAGTQREDGSFGQSENYAPWAERYWELTGSERAERLIVDWADAYLDGYGDGLGSRRYHNYLNIMAYAYFLTGEEKYAVRGKGIVQMHRLSSYPDEDSLYHGMIFNSATTTGYFLQRAPYFMEALRQAESGGAVEPDYPLMGCRTFAGGGEGSYGHGRRAYIRKQEGAPLVVSVWGWPPPEVRGSPIRITVYSPSGEKLHESEKVYRVWINTGVAIFSRLEKIEIPASAEPGVYLVHVSCTERFTLYPPFTRGDTSEVYEFNPGAGLVMWPGARLCFMVPEGADGVSFSVTGHSHLNQVAVHNSRGELLERSAWETPGARVITVPVAPGEAGKVWMITNSLSGRATVNLAGTPGVEPYFSTQPGKYFAPGASAVPAEKEGEER